MTIGEWLATRTPAPPPALAARVRDLLGSKVDDDASAATDRLLDAAEQTVAALLREGRTGRESAADLLAADALVTYAFEAAASEPHAVVERARTAMMQLARLAAVEVGSASVAARADASTA
jgi:uncharacterized membrane protein